MIETIVDPYGKAAFPTVVKCDGCGEVIESGWHPMEGASCFVVIDEERHYCDECMEQLGRACEFRICERCGKTMVQGYVIGDACTHVCEECFEPWMDENCPDGWRENPSGEEGEYGGYYDEMVDGEWRDTGAYWTQWY